jgi:3-deoxy-D-manno-octulosonic-acid transferase
MTWSLAAYRAVLAAARSAAPLAAHGSRKIAMAVEGRARSAREFTAWGGAARDSSRPLVLFHAASAGELRQAEPVIRRLRAWHPEWQLAATTFSPSGIPVARSLPVDVTGFLPWDAESLIAPFLDALRPTAIVVSKLDLWPMLTLLAARRGIRLGLVAGAVRGASGRLRWPARVVLTPAYASLDVAGAIGPEDAARLATLGVHPERITVTGDPRHDAVLERIATGRTPMRHESTLIAGSTWPRDERVLLEAFARVRVRRGDARLVLAPHEPTVRAVARIAARARAIGLPAPQRHEDASEEDPLSVVDEVGLLALLYGGGVLAYVGGGFGGAGLHSVLEPAAWGIPIIVGPGDQDNRDAARLSAAGALRRLPGSNPVSALTAQWLEWLDDEPGRGEAGTAARAVVEAGAGAADACADLVEEMIRPVGYG